MAELQKLRQHLVDTGRPDDHGVIDPGQLLDAERDRLVRINESAESVCDLSFFYPHGSDLDDPVGHGAETCGLDIKHHIGIVKGLVTAVFHQPLLVIHQITFYSVKDLEVVVFIQRMAGVGEGLDTAVVRDGDGGHPPFLCPFDDILHVGDSVHIAHLGVTVELYPLHQAVDHPLSREIVALFYTDD